MADSHVYNATTAQKIESKWQENWKQNCTYQAKVDQTKLSYFVLDMFPFPSGAGLHVGHPLGYIGTDAAARFARMEGKNVFHSMGFDAFGLPAEQYAIQTGQHPSVSTAVNIETYKRQLSTLGLGHDTTRSVATSDPEYYRWTQWIFLQIFNSFYDREANKARPINELVEEFESGVRLAGDVPWATMPSAQQRELVDSYRLAYRSSVPVNWCPGLGTVLADAEVTAEGRSERENFPVFKSEMTQWVLRITEYSTRLRDDLEALDWPESLKAQQRHWIGTAEDPRMRDWTFSRQRYWGEPFPIVFDEEGNAHALPESMLPVLLPPMEDFSPPVVDPDDADSKPVAPLARAKDWTHVELDLGDGVKTYHRETNTMPQWAGSSWYYLRYLDPSNSERFVSPEVESYWMGQTEEKQQGGVDLYVGGAEHAVAHLLYARFWHKVLFDLGHVSSPEPFHRLFNQGYVQAWSYRDSRGALVEASEVIEREGNFFHGDTPVTREYGKMGKSLKNSVTPDEVSRQYGTDTFRVYQMSSAPLNISRPWDTRSIAGSYRFLQRLWRLIVDEETGKIRVEDKVPSAEATRKVNVAIRTAREGYSNLDLNVIQARVGEAVASLNADGSKVSRVAAEALVLVVAPLAPHMGEELWERLGNTGSVVYANFPDTLPEAAALVVTYPVQVNGKVRAKIQVTAETLASEIEERAIRAVREHLNGTIERIMVVPGRIVSIVVQ